MMPVRQILKRWLSAGALHRVQPIKRKQPAEQTAVRSKASKDIQDPKCQLVPQSRLLHFDMLDLDDWRKDLGMPQPSPFTKAALVQAISEQHRPTYDDLCTDHLGDILYAERHSHIPKTRPALLRLLVPAGSSSCSVKPANCQAGPRRSYKHMLVLKNHLLLLPALMLSDWCCDNDLRHSGTKDALASRLIKEVQPAYQDLNSHDLLDMLEASRQQLPSKKMSRDDMIHLLLRPQERFSDRMTLSAQEVVHRNDKLTAQLAGARKGNRQAGFMVSPD